MRLDWQVQLPYVSGSTALGYLGRAVARSRVQVGHGGDSAVEAAKAESVVLSENGREHRLLIAVLEWPRAKHHFCFRVLAILLPLGSAAA